MNGNVYFAETEMERRKEAKRVNNINCKEATEQITTKGVSKLPVDEKIITIR